MKKNIIYYKQHNNCVFLLLVGPHNPGVVGSSPVVSTRKTTCFGAERKPDIQ